MTDGKAQIFENRSREGSLSLGLSTTLYESGKTRTYITSARVMDRRRTQHLSYPVRFEYLHVTVRWKLAHAALGLEGQVGVTFLCNGTTGVVDMINPE